MEAMLRVGDRIRALETEVRELRAEAKALAHANGQACDTIADLRESVRLRDAHIRELQGILARNPEYPWGVALSQNAGRAT